MNYYFSNHLTLRFKILKNHNNPLSETYKIIQKSKLYYQSINHNPDNPLSETDQMIQKSKLYNQ